MTSVLTNGRATRFSGQIPRHRLTCLTSNAPDAEPFGERHRTCCGPARVRPAQGTRPRATTLKGDVVDAYSLVSLIVALSVASERLVEIVKGAVPWLADASPDATRERWRRMALQVLAVASGVVTALLAQPLLGDEAGRLNDPLGLVALGLLASGGSGFWNAILGYVLKVKDIKKEEAAVAALRVPVAPSGGPVFRDLMLGDEQVTSNECFDVEEA